MEEENQNEEEQEKTFPEVVDEIAEERDDIREWGLVWTNDEGTPLMSWKVTEGWGGASSIALAAHSLYKAVVRNHHRDAVELTGHVYEAIQEEIDDILVRVETIEHHLGGMEEETEE